MAENDEMKKKRMRVKADKKAIQALSECESLMLVPSTCLRVNRVTLTLVALTESGIHDDDDD